MAKKIDIVLGFLSILFALMVLFRIVGNIEISIGFVTISFGILAVIWTVMAVKNLAIGSALRKHTVFFLYCLLFILLFSIWQTTSILMGWRKSINELMLYPGYFFITAAFIIFVVASYQALKMGKEFGFGQQASVIRSIIEAKKKNNKKLAKAK